MAFTYNIENIVKDTGLSEDELASLILNKANEGLTNEEIVDLLVSISDNNEYASKDQDEQDDQDEFAALQSLGLKPTGEKQEQDVNDDPGLFDRFKNRFAAYKDADEQRKAAERAAIKSKLAAAGESVANSVNDWRDSHPEQWRVGMVNALFGDNSMLSQHYAAKNAAEESEKNREAQNEYNEYLKEYDRANAQKEKDAAYKKELKDAEVEMASLNRDLVKADAPEAAVIMKRQESLIAKYPDLKSSKEQAIATQQQENEYQTKKIRLRSEIPTVFADENVINTYIANVMASDLRPQDKEELVKELQSKKSTAQLAREASQAAVASYAGQKTGKSLSEADLTAQALDAVKNNASPTKLKQEVRDKIREMGYTWTTNGWSKR